MHADVRRCPHCSQCARDGATRLAQSAAHVDAECSATCSRIARCTSTSSRTAHRREDEGMQRTGVHTGLRGKTTGETGQVGGHTYPFAPSTIRPTRTLGRQRTTENSLEANRSFLRRTTGNSPWASGDSLHHPSRHSIDHPRTPEQPPPSRANGASRSV